MQSSRVATPGDLDRPIRTALPSLARGAAGLVRLGITTPREALWYLPFRYDDFSELRTLRELVPDEKQSARVKVDAVRVEPGFGRRPQRVIAQLSDDGGGSAEAIWFGRRFVERRLQAGDEVIVSGKVTERGWHRQFTSPEFSPVGRDSVHTARVVPVYPLAAGVTQKRLRELLARILEATLPLLEDPLTDAERGDLPRLDEALQTAHFPEDAADVPRALDRLAFDELLALQLGLAQARKARDDLTAPAIRVTDADLAEIIGALPFTLTGDQAAAVEAIAEDLASERPMRRLLQGDVGSGKTAVAAVALASAVRAGWQGALMAPTEILARQHHAGLAPLLDGLGVRSEFLSGSLTPKRKREIHDAIAGGMAEVVIGTHAVISEAVEFPRLGLAIVDEQHRFGVGPARGAPGQGRGRRAAHARADRDADPADPGPDRVRRPIDQHDPRDAAGPAADPHRDPRPSRAAEDRGVPGSGGGGGAAVVRRRAARRRVGERSRRRAPRRRRNGCRRHCPGCASGSSMASSAPTCATRR